MPAKYDDDNIFARILDGRLPCHKIFETPNCLALLDAFPVCDGHALLICKNKAVNVNDMSEEDVGAFLGNLPRLVQLVKNATKADGVTVLQNNNAAAGQVVMHVHFHVIPRFEGDGLISLPGGSSKKLSDIEASAMLKKMHST